METLRFKAIVISIILLLSGCSTIYKTVKDTVDNYCRVGDKDERALLIEIINNRTYPNEILINCGRDREKKND